MQSEKCKMCGSKDYAVATDTTQRRYCSKCHYVWLPFTKDQNEIEILKEKIKELENIIKSLRNVKDSKKKETTLEIFK